MGSDVLASEGMSNLREDLVLLEGDLNPIQVYGDKRDNLAPVGI